MAEYIIAKYIRLSIEDAKTDSLSVENQCLILDRHIDKMDIPDAEVLEFVDNGYSGTNYERPAVQELLDLVRQGRVNCIVVKDLSRFGRNMIDTGYYLDRVFPMYRVRFIAVSDMFDSAEHDGGTGGLDVAFSLLVNEQYSRDLSQKIRTAKRTKALRGEHVVKNCAFGFKKVNGRLEIDEPAVETVRLIFELYKDGHSLAKIAARLYKDKRPTPGEYRKRADMPTCLWCASNIRKILCDEQYIGTYIAGKTRCVEIGRPTKVDEAEWIRIPDHHPALIDETLFYAVQDRLRQIKELLRKHRFESSQNNVHSRSIIKGKVICGCCNHSMQLNSAKDASFQCLFTRIAPDVACHRLRILGSELEIAVLNNIREHAQTILDSVPLSTEHQTGCRTQVEQIQDAKCALYERFVLKEISADEFKASNAVLNVELKHAKLTAATLKDESAENASIGELRKIAEIALNSAELTQALVDGFIDKVRVYPGNCVEVVWKHMKIEALACVNHC